MDVVPGVVFEFFQVILGIFGDSLLFRLRLAVVELLLHEEFPPGPHGDLEMSKI